MTVVPNLSILYAYTVPVPAYALLPGAPTNNKVDVDAATLLTYREWPNLELALVDVE